MRVSTLDAWMAAPIFLGVGILFRVPVPVGLVAIATTKLVEKEGKRKRKTPADASGFSRKCGAKQGADTEEKNQDFFHRGATLGTIFAQGIQKGKDTKRQSMALDVLETAFFQKMNPIAVLLLLLAALFTAPRTQAEPIRPKVIILTTFEIGSDTGDRPGELQYWVEREKLTQTLDVPGLLHPLRFNDSGVYAMLTGTCNRSGLAMMLLGSDPRVDLSQTYFIMAGIAGVDPNRASVGSAAWAQWVVDGDNVNEIDGHDAPKEWPYGILPYGATGPDQAPGPNDWSQKPMAFQLDPGLVAWAFNLSKDVSLSDTPELGKYRASYVGYPNAQRPPFVLIGDTLGSARYWHGAALTGWAENWCKLYTDSKANFVMTECEDQSIAYALYMLGRAHRTDPRRYLVLRTASNYCEPPPGVTVLDSLLHGEASGELLAVESAYRVGAPVVHELVQHWDRYATELPKQNDPAAAGTNDR